MGSISIVKTVLGFGDPSVEEFVDAVIYITKGDLPQLKCDYSKTNSVYGNISDKLCGRNKLLYRKWIHTIYNENRSDVKVRILIPCFPL